MTEPELQAEGGVTSGGARRLSEDWLAVILAFLLILLSALGIFGEHGLKIVF
jgi:hypothetical protein